MTTGVTTYPKPPYSYVVIFDGVTVPQFTAQIDDLDDVANWYTVLPQTVFIVSKLSAKRLAELIRKRIPTVTRLLVIDANNPTDRSGWLPSNAWDFLRKPKPADE